MKEVNIVCNIMMPIKTLQYKWQKNINFYCNKETINSGLYSNKMEKIL